MLFSFVTIFIIFWNPCNFLDLRSVYPVALVTKIINQLPLFATYRVFTVHKLQYMFRLYGHPQVYHIYKNAKIIIIIT
jgi:hypothetical protein